jgi:outer membrane protein TolC
MLIAGQITRQMGLFVLAVLGGSVAGTAFAQNEAPASNKPAPPVAVTPPQLTLEEAVRRAVARNESSRGAEKQVLAAEARVDRAEAFFYPEVTATGTYMNEVYDPPWTDRSLPGAGMGLRGDLAIVATLFDGRGFPLLRQAKLSRDAQKLESAQQKLLIAYDTASLYIAALSQDSVRKAAEARVELARASAQDARARAEAGLVSSNDVTRVELELSAAERDFATASVELGRARLRVGQITDLDTVGTLVAPAGLLGEALAQSALDAQPMPAAGKNSKRLDLMALDKRAEAAEAFADEPSWRLVPTASLAYGAFWGTLSLNLTWTLFDGGERYAERDERLALAAVAQLDAEAAVRRAGTETRDAMLSLSASRSVLEQAERTAEIARKNRGETAELYRQGLTTAFTVADASAQLFDAEVALVRARYSMALALLDLRRAYGLDPFGREPAR